MPTSATTTTGASGLTTSAANPLSATTINNPYATQSPEQLRAAAASGTQQAATTSYAPAIAAATTYAANTIDPNAVNNYTANQATGTNWNVDRNQTVQGQVNDIIAADSPLMQQARAQSLAQMNRRGLINSSMAVGAGQEAVIKNATPIATSDAATYAAAGKFGADTANNMATYNTTAQNEAAKFRATAANAALVNNQIALNDAAKSNATVQTNTALTNAAATNEASRFGATAANMSATDFAKNVNANVAALMDESLKTTLANADAATKVTLQNIDAQTRKDLAATEATYKTQMQASQSANEVFQQVTKNISDIMQNGDLNSFATTDGKAPTADKKNWPASAVDGGKVIGNTLYDKDNNEIASPKQAAVNAQKQYLKTSMDVISTTSNIPGLKDLLSFGPVK
jgi:hypothetical protein